MDNTLQLKIITSLQDKLSGPLKKIRGTTGESAKSIKDLRDQLKDLESTQKNMQAFVKVSAQARESKRQFDALATTSNKLDAEMQQLNKAVNAGNKAAIEPLKQLQKEFNNTQKAARKLVGESNQQAESITRLRDKLNKAGIDTKKLGSEERSLTTRIDQTSAALKKQTDQLRQATEHQNKLAKAKEKYQSTQQLASNMAITGTAGYMGGRKVLTEMTNIIQPGIEFDTKMSKVQSLTRLDADSEELKQLRQQSRDLGASTMFSATEAADAQSFLAMAGFNPKDIINSMPGLLDLAKAGDTELAQSADIASNILTGMNISSDRMQEVADVLTGAFTRSNTNLSMMGETMKYAAPIASSLGVDLETLAAATGKLGDAGIQGGMAGTALRSILNRLSAPPKAAGKALDALGVKTKDLKGNLRPLPDMLVEIYNKTKKMGSAQRAGFLKDIAGEEAVSAMQILVDQAGEGKLQGFIKTLKDTEGEASKVAKKMADNITGDLDELSSAWEDIGISIFEGQNSVLRNLVKELTDVVGSVGIWINKNPELTGTIIKSIGVVAALMVAFGGLAIGMAGLLGPFAMIKYGISIFGIKALSGIGILGKLTGAFKTVAMAILGMGKFLLTNPIFWILAAIAGAAYLIYQNWDFLKTKFAEIWVAIKTLFSDGWEAVSNITSKAWNSVSNLFSTAMESISGYLFGFWAQIKEAFDGGLIGIGALIINWSPMGLFYQVMQPVFQYLGVELPEKFTGFGSMIIQGLIDGIKGMASGAYDAIKEVGSGVTNWFSEKLGIKSPSRVFISMGGNISEGAAIGIERQQSIAMKAAKNMAASVMMAGAMVPMAASAMQTNGNELAPIRFDTRAPLSSPRSMPATTPVMQGGDNIEIHIHAAGMNPQDIARAVSLELDRRQAQKQSRRRSSYVDYGN
ncbi:MAG: phage tail tape measure protein [Alcaligenaceae bacterium]|nr:phage tail tape measure protein [Alcaligenaceae bacterium]